MTAGLQGHSMTCDNFCNFCSWSGVAPKKMTMLGTVRRYKPELPTALLTTKDRDRFSSKSAFTDTQIRVSYCPKKKKNVLLMTTLHSDASIRGDRKPKAVLDYNRNKGGVDNLDEVTGTYSCKRMTARWHMVFFNILDVSAYKAFVVWMEVISGWKQGKFFKRRLFLEELGKAMVAPLIQRHKHLPPTPSSAGLVRDIQGPEARSTAARDRRDKRKRCNLCAPRDVKTSIVCHKCSAHATTTTYCTTCA
ncbi:piggyBac transposable element-derived protein 4-like [Oncorhynchus kisutch]|uniref:piggyBac transposable element-derived protein 4-like n=1 Tax=Oncorhynchus kisutch TaxID=8019 RepID=UPI0012DDDBED|nr:piggyBac transposable element-derived protein 4-like [Oncorhynchus kisutch]